MSNSTIQTACEQRKISMQFNIPPVRNELVSPYPEFTSAQLNMRRKVEVLKYAKQSSQSRKMTSKEQQAQILRGNYRGNTLFCPDDYKISYSSSASGVPGPYVQLVEDKSVPLYNYLPNRLVNAVEVGEDNTEWSIYVLSNVSCPAGLDKVTNISTLLIREAIKKNVYTYTYTAPIVYTIQGTSIPIDTSGVIFNIDLNNISTKIYYGSNTIANNTSAISFPTNAFQITLQPSSTITTDTYSYSASLYVGYMTISNIYLNTSPGFSYNFGITYNASKSLDYSNVSTNTATTVSTNTTTILNNSTFSVVANVNDTYTIPSATNCVVNTSASSSAKTTTFSGV